MMKELEEEIRKRCRKSISNLDHGAEEEEAVPEEEFDEIPAEELPYEDILAEKRRDYTAKQDFVYLLYNDILPNFVNTWDGTLLRKKPLRKVLEDSDKSEIEMDDKQSDVVEITEIATAEFESRGPEAEESWRLLQHDEHVDVQFVNKNIYEGRVSRKMMEGEGLYKWNNGARYKGEFVDNRIEGKGLLEWSDTAWYEGEFADGCRHGRGTMVDRDYDRFYIGFWMMGRKHGKGYCRYAENDSYDGDWVMGKKEGIGFRMYANGARYIGEWQNDLRHGVGTIAWPNGDVYRGDWINGKMHGYGEYVWRTFFNKTLTWPQDCSYIGEWYEGMRHGEGILKLNSIGGARYSGDWHCNVKDGYGVIIGNNGEITEDDPLFSKDVLLSKIGITEKILEAPNKTEHLEGSCVDVEIPSFPVFNKKPTKIPKPRQTTVSRPEQLPSIWYHICRLLEPESLRVPSVHSIGSGRCRVCEDMSSCSCLQVEGSQKINTEEEQKSPPLKIKNFTPTLSVSTDIDKERFILECQLEEKWLYNCIIIHMPRIRLIYDKYAKLYSDSPPNCLLTMSRLSLWQFWRDCGIHKKGLCLAEIDTYLAANKSVFIEDAYYPFEELQIWQFIQALLEVAWHLYTKHNDIDVNKLPGKLGSGLDKFLEVDVYPNVENHVGLVLHGYIDTLSIFSIYELYKEFGDSPSVKELLRSMCSSKETEIERRTRHPGSDIPLHMLDGKNCVTVGARISYLPKYEESLTQKQSATNILHGHIIGRDLYGFRLMGAATLIDVMTKVCPLIKDTDNDIIINADYKLTMLEFYEILLESTLLVISMESAAAGSAHDAIEVGEEVPKNDDVEQVKLVRSHSKKSGKTKK